MAASFTRRSLLGASLALPAAGCTPVVEMFKPRKSFAVAPRADRMIIWLQKSGRDSMMAPEAFSIMGLSNGGRDIPVKQMAEDGPDGRYVLSLVGFRSIHEFVFHRRQGEVLVFHHSDTRYARLSSVRYPRNGKPIFMPDTAVAENDFQQQIGFWFDRMPGR